MGRSLISRTALVAALTMFFGGTAVQAQIAPPVENAFGIGVSIGGYDGFDTGISAFYAIPFDSDVFGLEVNGTYAQGNDFSSDFSALGVGLYGTVRFDLNEDIDLIGLGGLRYIRYSYDDGDISADASGFYFDLGAAAEYELGARSAVRAQVVTGGALDIMYVFRM